METRLTRARSDALKNLLRLALLQVGADGGLAPRAALPAGSFSAQLLAVGGRRGDLVGRWALAVGALARDLGIAPDLGSAVHLVNENLGDLVWPAECVGEVQEFVGASVGAE